MAVGEAERAVRSPCCGFPMRAVTSIILGRWRCTKCEDTWQETGRLTDDGIPIVDDIPF